MNRMKTDEKLNELIGGFPILNNHECLNEIEMEDTDTLKRTIKATKHTNLEHIKSIR